MQKKLSAFDRFCEFMRDTGRHALQATPQDIKVHMTLWATSSGRYKHQGLDLVAPISMRCLLSFLATEFDRYATTHGNWDPLHGRGNPSIELPLNPCIATCLAPPYRIVYKRVTSL